MPKRKPNQETFQDGNRELIFVADFGFLESVNSYGRDVSVIYSDLANGLMPPKDVRNVLISSIELGEECDKKEFVETLIAKYGLQECAILASVMLTHAMIGDVKKSAIENRQEVASALDSLTGLRSKSLKKAGLLWVAQLLTSSALACLIFKLFVLPTA